jgi:hypothetical protein
LLQPASLLAAAASLWLPADVARARPLARAAQARTAACLVQSRWRRTRDERIVVSRRCETKMVWTSRPTNHTRRGCCREKYSVGRLSLVRHLFFLRCAPSTGSACFLSSLQFYRACALAIVTRLAPRVDVLPPRNPRLRFRPLTSRACSVGGLVTPHINNNTKGLSKYLKLRPKGPTIASYYPDMRPEELMFYTNDNIETRLERLKVRRARGKGTPKKGSGKRAKLKK